MSRSKEGRENTAPQSGQQRESQTTGATFDERVGARGQTDYTAGRESYRDFPRRSTSLRGRADSDNQSRNLYNESQGASRRGEGRHSGRGRWDEERAGRSQRERGNRPSEGAGFEQRGRYENRYETERRYGRTPYDELTGRADRYRENERDFGSDPYNRESFSGNYGWYDREPGPSMGNLGWGAGSGIDYDQYRGDRYDQRVLRCGDIMTKDVTCCSTQNTVREVADMMEDENVGSIPVLENGRLIGIVTDRDIVCRIVAEGRDTRNTPVSEAMSQDIVTCLPDDSIIEAIRKMSENQIRRIPVTDYNGRLRGIIAMADIALEAERDRDLARAIEEISRPTPNRARRV
jgi:CBS domain-containing protein